MSRDGAVLFFQLVNARHEHASTALISNKGFEEWGAVLGKAELSALEAQPEDQVDTNDIPEVLDWSDARRGLFYRPVKRQITLRLDAEFPPKSA